MELSEFLFKLKDLLKDTCGKQAISRLIQFPLIFDFLNNPINLQISKERLGRDSNLWSPINICKFAAEIPLDKEPLCGQGINDNKDESTAVSFGENQTNNRIPSSLDEIYPLAEYFVIQNQKEPWKNILDHYFENSESTDDPKRSLETLLSVAFELTDKKNELIEALFKYSGKESGEKILARLVMMNESISERLIDSSNQILTKISENNFVKLIREMQFLGNQTNRYELCKKFLEYHPFKVKDSFENEELDFHDELNNLLYLKNYITILQAAGNKEEIQVTSNLANNTLASLEKKLSLTTALETEETENLTKVISKKFQTNASFGNQVCALQGTKLFQEIKRIKNLSQTDPDSASAIAKEVYKDLIIENHLTNSIFAKDFGFLIKPEDLIQIYIDLGLIPQANVISSLFLAQWPQNISLLRNIAFFASDYGNHKAAVDCFSRIKCY